MQYIDFNVQHQTITRIDDYEVVGKSRNFLYARFTFCEEWDELTQTAVFSTNSGKHYSALIEEGECLVPWEVLEVPEFWVGVVGIVDGNRVTTSTVRVLVKPGVKIGAKPGMAPTPTAYETLVANAAASAEAAETASAEATAAAELAVQVEQTVHTAVERAEQVLDNVTINEEKMVQYVDAAEEHAGVAEAHADSAAESEAAAIEAAGRAQAEADRATVPVVSGVYNVVLTDKVTNDKYALIVEEGRLALLGVSAGLDSAEVNLIDTSTGTAYELIVESGRLNLKEV